MANEIFEANPKLDYYFETSDRNCFLTKTAAVSHAKTLKDKKVKMVYNEALKSKASAEPVNPVKLEPVVPADKPVVE